MERHERGTRGGRLEEKEDGDGGEGRSRWGAVAAGEGGK